MRIGILDGRSSTLNSNRLKQIKAKIVKDARLWERIEVQPEDLWKHPEITPILTKSLGSVENVIQILRGSDAKEAIELVRVWDVGTKKEHSVIPFEAYCLAAKSTPKQMIGVIMQAVVEQSNTASELMVAAAHPDIIQKTIKMAKTNKGVDERKAVLQNRGFLPAPKNQVFNNYGSMVQDNRKQIANVAVSQLEEDSDKISEAVDRFNEKRVLKAPVEPIQVVDVTVED